MSLDDVEPHQQAALARFADLVASSPHNLVSKRARGELLSRHVPECVALAGLLPAGRHRLLDIGSGGGFPGVVIAVVRPDLDVHLLDSTRKKTAFLEATAAELGVTVTVHTGRAEELARTGLAGSFDLVTARAVAPLATLLSWAAPFLGPSGMLYAVKGERWTAELEEATPILGRLGLRLLATPDDIGASDAESVPRIVMIGRSR